MTNKSLNEKESARPLTADEKRKINKAWEIHAAARPTCEIPPSGWYCTRQKGHEGPCAAYPDPPPPTQRNEPSPAADIITRLIGYAGHDDDCPDRFYNHSWDGIVCTCGYSAAIADAWEFLEGESDDE